MSSDKVMTPEMAQKTIQRVCSDYLSYLRDKKMVSDSTYARYKSMLNTVLKSIEKPFMSITSDDLNEVIAKSYRDKHWSPTYVKSVIFVVSRLFYWAKHYNKNKPYTLKDICITSPIITLEVSNNPEHWTVQRQENTVSISSNSDLLSYPIKHIAPEPESSAALCAITCRNFAIQRLKATSNISNEEICQLSIYDFLHNHIFIQPASNRDLTRMINLDTETRNSIYRYLQTRTDNLSYLFLSNIPGNPLTVNEVCAILDKMKSVAKE